jgi:hypothetical protein
VTFTALTSEDHTVEMDPATVADNCSIDSANPQTATVPANGTETATFDVSCDDVPGDLTVETTTSGATPDPDGYTVTLDGGSSRSLGLDDSTTYSGIASTDHTVELTGLASNCDVINGNNPRTVTVPEGSPTTAPFDVECP